MAVSLSTGVELPEQATPFRGGLLDRALDLPEGWEQGVVVPFYGCGEPILRNKCIVATDEPHRGSIVDFQPFPIEQATTCSTVGNLDLPAHARARLDATSEWALGRQLQSDLTQTGNPKLDDADSLGTAPDIVTAVALLEENAAAAGFGTPWFIHAPVYAAALLERYGLIGRDGSTPAGGTWVISPGYLRPDANTVRLWVTGPVWADVDAPQMTTDVDQRVNSASAWALRVGLVAFDPCLNFSIDAPAVSGGGGGGGGATPAEIQTMLDSQTTDVNAYNLSLSNALADAVDGAAGRVQNDIELQTTAINTHTDTATAAVTTDVNENTDAEVQAGTTTVIQKLDDLFPESP